MQRSPELHKEQLNSSENSYKDVIISGKQSFAFRLKVFKFFITIVIIWSYYTFAEGISVWLFNY